MLTEAKGAEAEEEEQELVRDTLAGWNQNFQNIAS